MTKISEAIEYYESIAKKIGVVMEPTQEFKLRSDQIRELLRHDSEMIVGAKSYEQKIFDLYLGEPHVHAKISTLKLMQEALGDVDLSEEYLKVFISEFMSFPFKTPYERQIEKVRIIYSLSKDTEMTTEELTTLSQLYDSGSAVCGRIRSAPHQCGQHPVGR